MLISFMMCCVGGGCEGEIVVSHTGYSDKTRCTGREPNLEPAVPTIHIEGDRVPLKSNTNLRG
jgi:hypothetical protein